MEYNTDIFLSNIILINKLISTPTNMMLETNNNRSEFLKAITNLLETEDGFVLMDPSFLLKIENFIYANRFEHKNSKDDLEMINHIISKINFLNSKNDLQVKITRFNYLYYQEKCRKLSFKSEEQFFNSLAYDITVYENLMSKSLENINNNYFFLGTTNYFLEVVPELYQNNLFLEQTIKQLDNTYQKVRFYDRNLKKFAKETQKSLKKRII